ncbi:hypothetical protein DSECCO2_659780 [anaerobic digester metagenome]
MTLDLDVNEKYNYLVFEPQLMDYDELGGCLYHYTDMDGFLGITKKNKLSFWFSRYDSLNDKTEGKDFQRIFETSCSLLLKEKAITQSFYDFIIALQIKKQRMFQCSKNSCDFLVLPYQAYVCSFTKMDDSLVMWNSYVKNGQYHGCCMGLMNDIFEEYYCDENLNDSKKENEEVGILSLYRVIYNDWEKVKFYKERILKSYNLYKEGLSEEKIKNYIEHLLGESYLAFKDPAFIHEKEIRAVRYIPIDEEDKVKNTHEVKYRNRDGYIIPYIELEFNSIEYFLTVTLAPLINEDQAKNNMEEYLYSNGFKNVSVRKSEVPLRY